MPTVMLFIFITAIKKTFSPKKSKFLLKLKQQKRFQLETINNFMNPTGGEVGRTPTVDRYAIESINTT